MTSRALAVFAAVVAVAAPAIAQAQSAPPGDIPGPKVGAPAPDFALTTLDGRRVTLRDYRGKTLVLNVWGSWCPPCRLEQPDLIEEAKAGAPRVAFLGIDTTERAEVVRAYVSSKGVNYPQVVTTGESAFAKDYAIRNYPTTLVIDPSGIVRAVHADNVLPRPQLHAFIVAAQRGASAPLMSAEQAKLDAMLDPAKFAFTGDPATIRAGAAAAEKAIQAADDELDAAMSDTSRDHDYVRTKREEQALRSVAIAALAPVVATDADRALLALLQGDAYAEAGDDIAADRAYAAAPTTVDADTAAALLQSRAAVAARRGDTAAAIGYDRRLAEMQSTPDAYITLARVAARANDRPTAESALDRALTLARDGVAQAPSAAPKRRLLAWSNLYAGRTYIQLGEPDRARAAFRDALEAAKGLPPSDKRYAMYLEQAQEAAIALDLAGGAGTALSLAPWTGPTLPGSIPDTVKFRVAAAARPGAMLRLRAAGLPKGWIASFCTDKVCAPFGVTVVVPPTGVKVVELQVVAPDAHAKATIHPTLHVEAVGVGKPASVSTVVASR